MFFHKTPFFVKWLYPQLTWSVNASEKIIYLTFDDGPIPELTEFILDTLDAFEAKATFFCVGDNLRKYPEIANKASLKGHSLGNHTFNHIKGWSTATTDYLDNVQQCNEQLIPYNQNGNLFRPPYGKIKRSQINQVIKSHRVIMWDVLTGDYNHKIDAPTCLKKSISATNVGSIVLFHDNKKAERNLKYVLPRYLEHFKKEGYHFHAL